MARNALLWASTNPTLSQNLPRMAFVRRAVRKFMPGERLEDALDAAERMKAQGMPSIVTRLGESITELSEAAEVRDHYLAVYEQIAQRGLDCWVSIKPTQLGLELDKDYCAECLEMLATEADRTGSQLWIDMEYSHLVDVTIELFKGVRANHDNVGLCLQSYLYRTDEDLDELIALSSAIRLVKGAYAEPADIAYPDKKDVDQKFFEQAGRLLEAARAGGAVSGIATHDEGLVERIAKVAADGDPPAPYEIQMLYGIAEGAQKRWAKQGRTVRILISYGDAWYPWYMRRLAERPANVGFVLRNMFKS
jgi:proline dehydrogenase